MKINKYLVILLCLLTTFFAEAQDSDLYVPEVGESVNPKMKVIHREKRDGYECRLIEFNVESSERIRAYLLVPDKASRMHKRPAVLMLHDHGARFDIGKEKYVRPMAAVLPDGEEDNIMRSSQQWIDKNFDGVYLADSLAALGYVVFAADALYWGERSSETARKWSELNYSAGADPKRDKARIKELKEIIYEGQRDVYDSLKNDGIIWAEKMLRDDIASVRLLRSLSYVDGENIGAFGFSMGAHRCWMLSAFCEDVKCGVALSWITTLDDYNSANASDLSMRIQPMRDQMDFGDIGMFLAPKPMMFINGDVDHLFSKPNVETAFRKLQGHYAAYNRVYKISLTVTEPRFEPLQTVFFSGGHHCGKEVQKIIAQFFKENLL